MAPGAGQNSTPLQFADEPELELAGLLRVEGSSVTITDMTLDGNRERVDLSRRSDGQDTAFTPPGAENANVRRVTAASFPGYGFGPHASDLAPSRNIVTERCRATDNGYDGITFAGWKQEQFAAVSGTRTTDTEQISHMKKGRISRSEASSAAGTVRAVWSYRTRRTIPVLSVPPSARTPARVSGSGAAGDPARTSLSRTTGSPRTEATV